MKTIFRLLVLLLTVALLLIAIHAVYAQEPGISLEEVQKAIEEKGYDWQAGETSVSRLSEEERTRFVGALLDEEEILIAEAKAEEIVKTFSYPPAIDWRNVNGEDWTTSIKNQDSCASCVAFGTLGAIESRLEIINNKPDLSPDLSESHLFSCGGGNCSYGWFPFAALDFATVIGVADEACFPYQPRNLRCTPCPDWRSRVTKIQSWWGTVSVGQMKQALAEKGPFEATMDVYYDFFYYTGGVYRRASGSYAGGHAVTIAGYDDRGRYWIAKNSWGTGWGENGWFRIAYGQCGIDNYAYIPELNSPTIYSISGYVRDSNGYGIEGVTISINGQGTVLTDADGFYIKTALAPGTYILTSIKRDYTFSPSSLSVIVSDSDVTDQDFTGTYSPWLNKVYLPLILRGYPSD